MLQTTLRKEQWPTLFVENTVHSFLSAEKSKTEIPKPIVVTTNEIYQQEFLLKLMVWGSFARPAITES